MNRPVSALALASFVILAAVSAHAQFMPKKIWTLTVAVNVPTALIFVDNQQIPGNQTQVTGGAHNVNVLADGSLSFNGPVMVSGNQTFAVNLQPAPAAQAPSPPPVQPAAYPLTINVSVPTVAVFVDGIQVQGTPLVTPGLHNVQVSADGYQDYSAQVNVAGPLTLNVVLNPVGFLLTVNSNVADATVVVNNIAKGTVPYSEVLPPNTYSVRGVSARGFLDYSATVSLDRPPVITASLQPLMLPSTLSFVIPQPYLDPNVPHDDPRSEVRIFIDGRLVNPHG
jgi:hypothetical protein